ncbi:MAG: glycoside hydrolase family 3 C-terminal domain-containing protein [Oscillospiraceae bacterium]|nr:glycoside hydrolase family 3 C-terminal domain-containing protein [Oscillospiraceae bacterium]
MDKNEKLKNIIDNLTVPEKVSQLTNSAAAISRFSIKKYDWWNEALHGVARAGNATVFPQAIGLAAAFNEELLGKIAAAISDEARAKYNDAQKREDFSRYYGLTFWSPNINIFRDPRWGRGQETYGEDPYLTSRLGVSFIKNLQQKKDGRVKAAACAKHFAVHSGPEGERHGFNAEVGEKDLRETYLPAFEAAVKEAGVEAVMGAYNAVNGEPCCCNKYLLKDILRDEWGFSGHVVSDCGAIYDISENHKFAPDKPSAAAVALKNGCDLNCGEVYEKLIDAYEQDMITEKDLDIALYHTLGTRDRLGMLGDKTEYDDIPMSVVACEEHKKLSLQAAMESFVLLKNDGILPLNKAEVKKIAVLGPNANCIEVLLGNYYGYPTEYSTVFEGIKEYLGENCEVVTARGCSYFNTHEDDFDAAFSLAKDADAVILCMGLNADYEGEQGDANNPYAAGDRLSIELPDMQVWFINKVFEQNKNTVLLNFSGGAFSFGRVDASARAIMQCWYPGEQGGRAIAKTLFGEYSPSGKLPVTFYETTDDLPDFSDYSMKNRTYRYFTGEPAYPFGFGLSYTSFIYSAPQITYGENFVKIKVSVKNTGAFNGAEVIKLFRSEINAPENQPIKSLIRFKKIDLKAGQSREVEFAIPAAESYRINDDGKKEYLALNAFEYFFS